MEAVVNQGLVKSIGVTNFSIKKLENLLKTAKIVPAVNQSMLPSCVHPSFYNICISIIQDLVALE